MKFDVKIFFCLLFSCVINFVFSQENDSLVTENLKYDSLLYSDDHFLSVLFYKHQNDVLMNNLGPFGSPYYYPTAFSIFHSEKHYLNKNNVYRKKISELKGIKPFTNITYINASRKEQLFSINHIQQFGKDLSFNFDYIKVSSPGLYLNQEANNSFFDAEIKYKSKNESYKLIFSSLIRKIFLEENGGLLNATDFENNIFKNRRTYSVQLLGSSFSKKRYEFKLDHFFNIWSSKNDSITTSELNLKFSSKYIINKKVFNDNDPLSSIYNDIYIDSTSSIDSIYENSLINSFALGFEKNKFNATIYTSHQFGNYFQSFGIDTNYNNISNGISAEWRLDKLNIALGAEYGVYGYNKEDISTNFKFDYKVNKDFNIKVKTTYELKEPNLKYVNYSSNHFEWSNYHFSKQSIFATTGSISFNKIKTIFTIGNKLITNALFFNSNALAKQTNNTDVLSTFSITKN
jgi:hypothetical protein